MFRPSAAIASSCGDESQRGQGERPGFPRGLHHLRGISQLLGSNDREQPLDILRADDGANEPLSASGVESVEASAPSPCLTNAER
jgi:hypothetical protein